MSEHDAPSENPYSSPRTASPPNAATSPRFRLLAVFVGWIVDIGLSSVFGIAFGILYAILTLASGTKTEELQKTLQDSVAVNIAGFVIGTLSTGLGGYVAAWMGKVFPLRHAFAMGMLSLSTGLAYWAISPSSMSLGHGIAALAVVLPAALLGGYVQASRSKKHRSEAHHG